MITLNKIFFSTVGLILLFVISFNILGTRADIVAGVTGNKIKLIQLGWTLEQVIETLGSPYKIEATKGFHNNNCQNAKPKLDIDVTNLTDIRQNVNLFYSDSNFCCEGNKDDFKTKEVTLTYTRPVRLSKHYPMLWIHLDSSFKVKSIYAKQYDGLLGLEDPSIYGLYSSFDSTTMKNKVVRYIDELKYNDCFK